MKKAGVEKSDREVYVKATELANKTKEPAVAIKLSDGRIVTGKTSKLMGASSAAILNALKTVADVPDIRILSEYVLEPIQELKTKYLNGNNPRLHTDEVLIALAIGSRTSEYSNLCLRSLPLLAGAEAHSSVILSEIDVKTFKKLGMHLTMDPIYQSKKLYHNK